MFVHTGSPIQNPGPMSLRRILPLPALFLCLLAGVPAIASGSGLPPVSGTTPATHTLSILVVDEQQNPIEGGVLFIDGDPGTEAVTGPGGGSHLSAPRGRLRSLHLCPRLPRQGSAREHGQRKHSAPRESMRLGCTKPRDLLPTSRYFSKTC